MRYLGSAVVLTIFFVCSIALSFCLGAREIPFSQTLEALIAFEPDNVAHVILWDLRLPRTAAAVLAGAALGASGVVMQTLTRNPLADPGLLGVNAGAALSLVAAAWVLGVQDPKTLVWFTFPGAAVASAAVYLLGTYGRNTGSPVRLALAGASFSALFLSIVSAIILTHQESLETYRFWMIGSVAGVRPDWLFSIGPFIAVGLFICALVTRGLKAIELGEDTAAALGTNIVRVQVLSFLAVTLCCGASVALTGPIGFVGLVTPHLARYLSGGNLGRTMLFAAILGPVFLLLGDTFGRLVLLSGEIPVGIMTALVGGPLFVSIVLRLEQRRMV